MRVNYDPIRSDVPLSYSIVGEAITATQDGVSDTFDFSSLPEGKEAVIDSVLSPCPVRKARRENGELIVTLRKHHGPNASREERFPEEEIV